MAEETRLKMSRMIPKCWHHAFTLENGGTYTGGTQTDRYEGALHHGAMHRQGTFTSTEEWSFTGALARNRPTAGVLTEASGRRFAVTYAADCKTIQNAPTPATKVSACVCACACARGLLPTGASACTVVLSLTLSRFLSLVPSLYRCLFLCVSLAVARARSLSLVLFLAQSVCFPLPVHLCLSPYTSRCRCLSHHLQLSRALFLLLLSHSLSLAFTLSLAEFLYLT